MKNHLLDAALDYIRLGWAVFPLHHPVEVGNCSCGDVDCSSPGKHPRTGKGVLDATHDEVVARDWWRRWPHANIGLATGAASRVWVLDLDTPEAIHLVEAALGGPLPLTESVITGRGRHLYWYCPDDLLIGNRAAILGPESGVDVRGNGGYVVAPPSLHPNGVTYEREPDGPDQGPIPAPQALIDLVLKPVVKPASPKLALVSYPKGTPEHRAMVVAKDDRQRKYLEGAINRAAESVRNHPPGGRNNNLNREAYSLAGLEDIADHEIYTALGDAARTSGLPEREINNTIASGIRKGRTAIRALPEPTPLPKRRAAPIGPASGGGDGADGTGDGAGNDDDEFDPNLPKNLTDTGNAERFLSDHGLDVRYTAESEKWYIWDGVRWHQDRTNEVQRRVKTTVRKIKEEAWALPADTEEDKKEQTAILQWAHKSESAERRGAMLRLAATDSEKIQVVPEQFDADSWLLNCANGIVDLRTGELHPHKREVLATKLVPVSYDPLAKAPIFEKFLREIMQGSQELIEFLQLALGYTLTGETKEQCLFFLHGTGSNGKTTLLEVLAEIVSDYGQKAEFKTFMVQKNDGPRNDLAALKGARYVAASEAEGNAAFAEAFLKEVTGGDTVKCRFLHEEFFEFKPQFKIWLAANHKPVIKGTDDGIWRRLRLIPFDAKFEDAAKDADLPRKLRTELPGILAWMVRGTLRWIEEGLPKPKRILEATAAYREDMDILADFFVTKKKNGDNYVKIDPKENCPARSLYKAYKQWAADEEAEPVSEVKFGTAMAGKGFGKKRTKAGNVWHGIGVVGIASQPEML